MGYARDLLISGENSCKLAEMNGFISIIGTSIGSRDFPTKGERWGLAWHHSKGFDRLFEMHDPRYYKCAHKVPGNLWALPHAAKKWGCNAYPLAQVRKLAGGRNYFTSSVSYMLALAIYEGNTEIEILGVDLVEDTEYAYQRPCMEYWCGIARGKGINLHIPRQSALLRHSYIYGQERVKEYGELNGETGELVQYLDNQIALVQREGHKMHPMRMAGTLDAFQCTKKAINEAQRGADMSRLGEIK